MTKIAFVAHEFGMFKGRGGIATYLYYLAKGILKEYHGKIEVYVISIAFDEETELLRNRHFHHYKLSNSSLMDQGLQVLQILKKIRPEVVEVADAFAFCYEALIYKNFIGKELEDCKFFVINHTASRECFEWSHKLPLKVMKVMDNRMDIYLYHREHVQMMLAENNIYPAEFLKSYCERNYGIKGGTILRYTYDDKPEEKKQLVSKYKNYVDYGPLDNSFVITYLSRFEGRKNQELLVKEFATFAQKVPRVILLLVGNTVNDKISGEDVRYRIYKSIDEETRKKVRFIDFADKKMLEKICAVTDLTVMTSPYENFPFAMIENVWRGIPIMTSKYNGCVDFFGEYKDMMSFNPFAEGELAEKIFRFYGLDDEKKRNVVETQKHNLQMMCNVRDSVRKKIKFYSEYNKKSALSERLTDYVCATELNKSIPNTQKKHDIFLYTSEKGKQLAEQLKNSFLDFILNIPYGSIVVFYFGINFDVNIEESLTNGCWLYIKDVIYPSNNTLSFYRFLSSVLVNDASNCFYIQVPTEAYDKKDDMCKCRDKCRQIISDMYYADVDSNFLEARYE